MHCVAVMTQTEMHVLKMQEGQFLHFESAVLEKKIYKRLLCFLTGSV